jgi:DNA-directed RNA polymerase subunit omega
MAHVTIEDCLHRITNRFALTLVGSRRARQLANGSKPLIENTYNKPVVTALREISAGKVGIEILNKNSS